MNSITLDYSFWAKAGQNFLNSFIGIMRLIVHSESSIVRGDVQLRWGMFLSSKRIHMVFGTPILR